ncbi:MAG: penicillin-insensitive murein endopeptidase [Nannocystaceae bacterium]
MKSDEGRAAQATYIVHRTIPGESLAAIAQRYGIKIEVLVNFNQFPDENWTPATGHQVRIPATRGADSRQMLLIRVREAETWTSIATNLGVSTDTLKMWNPEIERSVRTGDTLRCWLEPDELHALRERRFIRGDVSRMSQSVTQTRRAHSEDTSGRQGRRSLTTAKPTRTSVLGTDSTNHSESVGRTNRGRLVRGVQLPSDDPAFLIVRPKEAWATDYVVRALVSAMHRFQQRSSYGRRIAIASLSRQQGGTLKPHHSHQSGRDADIRLPVLNHKRPPAYKPSHRAEVDWDAAWILVHELLKTDRIKYIFLVRSGQRMLYRAARRAGLTPEEATRWFQFSPKGDRPKTIIRHADGHVGHIHVRFECAPHDARCQDR